MKNIVTILFIGILFKTGTLNAQMVTKDIKTFAARKFISGIGWDEWSEDRKLNSYSKMKIAPKLGGIYVKVVAADGELTFKLLAPTLNTYKEEAGVFEYTGKAEVTYFDRPKDKCTYKLWIRESYHKLYSGALDQVIIWFQGCNKHEPIGWKFQLAN